MTNDSSEVNFNELHKLNFEYLRVNLQFFNEKSKRKKYEISKLVSVASEFVISEKIRSESLLNEGLSHNVMRGRVPAESIMRAWALQLLENCSYSKIPPPTQLCHLFSLLMNYNLIDDITQDEDYYSALSLKLENPEISYRQVAKKIGVNVSTVSKWFKKKRLNLGTYEAVWFFTNNPEISNAEISKIYDIDIIKIENWKKGVFDDAEEGILQFIKIIKSSKSKKFLL